MKIKYLIILYLLSFSIARADERGEWVEAMLRIAEPVLTNQSAGTLSANMPFESLSPGRPHREVGRLEALGRTICGIAPWLELGADNTPEGKLREKYISMSVKALQNAVNPDSPDYLVFGDGGHGLTQPLVDAAFLAQGLLRAPTQLWGNLDTTSKKRVIEELKRSRTIKPHESNWLLFASIVEAAILEFDGQYDEERLYYGINRFLDEWYKGDGWYGDGKELHLDYYNSIVIHPLLTDVLRVLERKGMKRGGQLEIQLKRHTRLAGQLERIISPDATYPVVGRSIVYRFGVMHALSQAALLGILPKSISPAQVRNALTAVISRQLSASGTFDADGWLRIGFAGSQINMSEPYINTGSLYMCMAVFCPLGLPVDHVFWTGASENWTSKKAWDGIDVGRDHALKGE
ncbi:DUF2264 domain-containing protein [uncultured Bacteroides sp.]|uniref:DUF2264 domain-containing protein n=1 Tax=uncultured Bacteroides sp. TaxID=162156 RepID=UPI0025F6AAE4|nr:DUF2264 domain-containing protein [uncultured Bacteroides sp.]